MDLITLAKTLAKWVPDVLAMPTRIRLIAAARVAEDDPRPTCTKCGVGRVAAEGRRKSENWSYAVGRCEHCGQLWQTSDDGSALASIWTLD